MGREKRSKFANDAKSTAELASSLAQKATKKEVDRYIMANVSEYGAVGDGITRTISSVFPSVTLSEVQALNSNATLSNSADWYAIQLCVNENEVTHIPNTGSNYMIDLPINVPNNHSIYGNLAAYPNGTTTTIKNVGIGTDAVILNDGAEIQKLLITGVTGNSATRTGNGILVKGSYCKIKDCTSNGNGGYGIRFADVHVVTCWITDNMVLYNQMGGIYGESRNTSSMICIYISGGYIGQNGRNDDGTIPTIPLTDWGDGIRFDGGININIEKTVSEYNYGAGIKLSTLTTSNTHTFLGVSVLGNHLEGNRLAELHIANQTGNLGRANVLGNHYLANNATDILIDIPTRIGDNNIENRYGTNNLILESIRHTNGIMFGMNRIDKEKTLPINYKSQFANEGPNSYVFIDHNVKYLDFDNPFVIYQNNRQRYLLKFQYRVISTSLTQGHVYLYPRKIDGSTAGGTITTVCGGTFGMDSGWIDVCKIVEPTSFTDTTDSLQMSTHWNGTPVDGDKFMIRDVEFIPLNNPILPSYATANRPTKGLVAGTTIRDSTLDKQITWNGTVWKDAMGTTV
jgi:hypothetical protein